MNTFLIIIITLAVLILCFALLFKNGKKVKNNVNSKSPFPESSRELLQEYVPFYQGLSTNQQKEFEQRMLQFLSQVSITGIKTEVEELDNVLIAASAIIPIFNFPGWEYVTLHEVLLYPDSFDHHFEQKGPGRSILGMVGNGPLNHLMVLSKFELRQAFINKTGKENTAIHEFVHLVDKTDGDIDGIPSFILEKKYILPWLQLMHKEIELIKEKQSDINPYGATNEAEFFAVVAEYFFERPRLLKAKHPALYELLVQIFQNKVAT